MLEVTGGHLSGLSYESGALPCRSVGGHEYHWRMVDSALLEQVMLLDESARRELRDAIDESLPEYISPQVVALLEERIAEADANPMTTSRSRSSSATQRSAAPGAPRDFRRPPPPERPAGLRAHRGVVRRRGSQPD